MKRSFGSTTKNQGEPEMPQAKRIKKRHLSSSNGSGDLKNNGNKSKDNIGDTIMDIDEPKPNVRVKSKRKADIENTTAFRWLKGRLHAGKNDCTMKDEAEETSDSDSSDSSGGFQPFADDELDYVMTLTIFRHPSMSKEIQIASRNHSSKLASKVSKAVKKGQYGSQQQKAEVRKSLLDSAGGVLSRPSSTQVDFVKELIKNKKQPPRPIGSKQ